MGDGDDFDAVRELAASLEGEVERALGALERAREERRMLAESVVRLKDRRT